MEKLNTQTLPQPIFDKEVGMDPRKHYKYESSVRDMTSYPVFETNISLKHANVAYYSFLSDGGKLEYRTRGEKFRFSDCSGDVCIVITDRNLLAVSNYASEWSKNNFFSEVNFKTKLGAKALFVATESNVYYYNGYYNEWGRFPLNGEFVRGLSVKNDIGAIVTNKRIVGFDFENRVHKEYDTISRSILNLEIKVHTVEFMSNDRSFQYTKGTNSFNEFRVDR